MPAWNRDSKDRLVSFDSIIPIMTDVSTLILLNRCYLLKSFIPSCIKLSTSTENNYELKPQFISMLPKFTGSDSEDVYIFISEFEEVCVMMKVQQLSYDAIRLRFITFALTDNAK